MMQLSLRRAVIAARAASREEIKTVTVLPASEPPPPTRDWLVVTPREQHDTHVIDYTRAMFAKWAPASFEDIRRAVCLQFGVTRLEIISRRRDMRVARARQTCMYLARNLTSYSFPQIGQKAGGFDHSTVMHAVKKIAELRTADPELDAAISAVERGLQTQESP